MRDIIDPVDTSDGLFHDGDPSTGVEGTVVHAKWLNAQQGATIDLQTEIKAVLNAAGMSPNPSTLSQLLSALQALFLTSESAAVKNALLKGNNLSDVVNKATALANLSGVANTRKVNGRQLNADISLTASDVDAIPDGSVSGGANAPAWDAKSGMYNLSLDGASQMVFHLNQRLGSCPSAQFKFDYKNRGIWYRTARDKFGFEADWSELLTHTGSMNITGPLRSSAEYQATKPDNFRIAYNGYGVFWRNDGIRHYLMVTNKNDIYGGYNSLRPFYVDIATGKCQFGHDVGFSGNIYGNGVIQPGDYSNFDTRYYTKSQTDAAYMGKTVAYTKAEVDSRINTKGPTNTASKAVNGWWKCGSTGVIIQWGQIPAASGERVVAVTFPVAFPSAVCSMSGIIANPSENVELDAFLEYTNLNNRASVRLMLGNTTGGWSMGGCWMAIGY